VLIALNYDLSGYFAYLGSMYTKLQNKDLANLYNANAINNLPAVNIASNNETVNQLQSCRDGPVFMGVNGGSDFACKQLCGARGQIMQVNRGDEIFSNGEQLGIGTWCSLNPPNCNMNTTYAVATANSVACRSKYPRIFGGDEGRSVIACNNAKYFNVNNKLWDELDNRAVTQYTQIQHEDEQLPSGDFRFKCHFDDDSLGNRYIPHHIDRLHPMRNYCTHTLNETSRQITQTSDGCCDCGIYQNTRVRNRWQNNTATDCTNCFFLRDEMSNLNQIGSDCFTQMSPFSMAFTHPPCVFEQFVGDGNFCMAATIPIIDVAIAGPFPFHPSALQGTILVKSGQFGTD